VPRTAKTHVGVGREPDDPPQFHREKSAAAWRHRLSGRVLLLVVHIAERIGAAIVELAISCVLLLDLTVRRILLDIFLRRSG